MGLDLDLCPETFPKEDGSSIFLAIRLSLNFDDDSFYTSILSVATKLSVPVEMYGEEGLKSFTDDPYGDSLGFITAGLFLKLWDAWNQQHKYFHKEFDQAAIAYIRALRPERRLILWWH